MATRRVLAQGLETAAFSALVLLTSHLGTVSLAARFLAVARRPIARY